jgi:pyruvate,water dikinase
MRVKKNVIKERSRMHGFLVHGGRVKLITGPALARKMEKYGSVKTDIAEIKGSIACSGSVSGRAKIVLSSSKQDKVKVGDILVTTMTTPDFLPSMRRASAFITDEGGITCHAAIVAREMRKPCIIGTKIATNVLKDGDDLEVDANRGIVKIRK